MDDQALWADSSSEVTHHLAAATTYLKEDLDLEFKPDPSINRVGHGMDFLGCRVFPEYTILNRRSRVRFQRKLRQLEAAHLAGRLYEQSLQQRSTELIAFMRTPGLSSWRFRRGVVESMRVGDLD